jgi:hypothetical protein
MLTRRQVENLILSVYYEYLILCTGAFLYALYSFLLISIKFWMGGRVGVRSAVMLLYRTGGVVWALKPSSPFKVTSGLLYIKPLMHP